MGSNTLSRPTLTSSHGSARRGRPQVVYLNETQHRTLTTCGSRLKRYQSQGHDHFITFSCYRRLPLLSDDYARTTFLHTLEHLRQRHQFELHGYVLMPEHVHLLLSEPPHTKLDDIFRALKTQTSRQLKGDRKQFWQTRYYDFNVFTHPKWLEKLHYIHQNPVTRGLGLRPEDWPWSTCDHWPTGEPTPVQITTHWPEAAPRLSVGSRKQV